MFVNEVGVFVDSPMQHVHTLGLFFVTPYKNYFLADENKISADGIFVSPDVIGIISPSLRTASTKATYCESEGVGLKA